MYVKYLDKTPKGEKNAYGTLKRVLMGRIVKERIYQTERLDKLYEETVQRHQGLDQRKLRVMWGEIMNDLNA